LAGNFFNLAFAASQALDPTLIQQLIQQRTGFSQEFNSRIDRGNADFDKRHDLTVVSTWEVPAFPGSSTLARLTRGWRISELAAFRSGFPFSVIDKISQPSTVVRS